jgi:hypothetical protein
VWFKKRKAVIDRREELAEKANREIAAHKDAKLQVVKEAKQANQDLKKLLVANGFTFKIYLGAGGRAPQTHRGIK